VSLHNLKTYCPKISLLLTFGKQLFIFTASILYLSQFSYLTLPANADNNQVIELNNDGVRALNSGNVQLAMQKFEQALKLDPTYQLARDNLAIAHNNSGLQLRNNPKAAIKEFHQAIYLNPNNSTTQSNLAGIISMMNKNPHSFTDRVQLGDDARHSGDIIGAIIEYSEALKIKDDRNLHLVLGDLYRVQDNPDKAINELKIAVLTKDDADVEVKLGQAYQAKNDLADAIDAYSKAVAFKPDDTDVQDALYAGWEAALKADPLAPENHIGLAQALQFRGDFGQARQELLQAIRLAQTKNSAAGETAKKLLTALPDAERKAKSIKHINSGVDLQSRQLYDQALDEYNLALQLDPNNASILVNLGTAYQAKGDFDNATVRYKQALQLDPNNSSAKQGLQTASAQSQDKQLKDISTAGDILFKQGKYDEALQKYKQLLDLNPQSAVAHFDLGATYQAKGDLDAAIDAYHNAINNDSDNDQYKKALTSALDQKAKPTIDQAFQEHKNKNYAKAIELYQQALQMVPNNASLWFNMASAEYARQNYIQARDDYAKALKLDRPNQLDDLYFIATIDDNNGKGTDALYGYKQYLKESPKGNYADNASARVSALSQDSTATAKIKTDVELAQIQDAAKAYQQAVQLQQQQHFDEALPLYQQAINLQPKEPTYAYALGTLYQQKGDMDQAVSWYNQASNLDPKNKEYANALKTANEFKADALVDQAVQKQTSGDLTSAIDLYKQAGVLAPQNARLWTDLGTAYQQSDQYKEAQAAYQKGYDLDNKNEVGDLYLIGAIQENYKQGALALTNYKKYLSLASNGPYAAAAQDRIKALSIDIMAVQQLKTADQMKTANQAQDDYNQAVQAQTSNNLDQAITLYQKAISEAPSEPSYVYALGTAYQAKNDLDNAISFYEKTLSLAPKNPDYKKVYITAKQLKSAPIMDDAVKKHTAGDIVGAIPLYEQALSINPEYAHGWTNLASAYQASNNFSKALEAYNKAYSLDNKGEADNLYFIGLLDENAGQGGKAIQDYSRYLTTAPHGTYVNDAKSRMTALKANPSQTQKILTANEQTKLNEGGSAYDQAVKLQQENKLDEALEQYKMAIASQPNEASYYYGIGTCYASKNDLPEAIKNYQKAISLNPQEPNFKQALKQTNQAQAAPLINSAIKKQTTPDSAGKYDLTGAIADYEAALKIDDDANTRLNLGTAYQANNNLPGATTEYKRALQLNPNSADAHYYLGTIYDTNGQTPLAVSEYQKYLKMAPNGASAADARARLKALGH